MLDNDQKHSFRVHSMGFELIILKISSTSPKLISYCKLSKLSTKVRLPKTDKVKYWMSSFWDLIKYFNLVPITLLPNTKSIQLGLLVMYYKAYKVSHWIGSSSMVKNYSILSNVMVANEIGMSLELSILEINHAKRRNLFIFCFGFFISELMYANTGLFHTSLR